MIFARKQSTTTYPIQFPMRDTSGVLQTGKTVSINISKNGGAFGAASGAITEIGSSGVYSWAGNATDRNTLGELRVTATATGCDATDFTIPIVAYDPFECVDANVTKVAGTAQSAGDLDAGIDTIIGYVDTEIANIAAAVSTVDGKINTIDTIVDAILLDTAEIGAAGAGLTALASAANLATVAGYIDTEIATLQTSVNDIPTNSELTTALSGLATTTQLTTVEGKIDTVDGVVDAIKLKTDTITDIYTAQIEFAKDTANTRDEYNVTWLKNGIPQTSGITSPTIQVVKRDATNLIASTAMTNSGSGVLIYNEATNRTTAGESYKVIAVATIDAASRTFTKWIGRDL